MRKMYLLSIKQIEKKLKMYKETMDKVKAYLEEENIVSDKDIGNYYGICETRPYMRTRNLYIRTVIELGRYKEALEHCKEMVKLSENDNLGVRYTLIRLYTMLEEFDKVQEVYKYYGDDRLSMSLPLAISYYKKADYRKCKSLLKKIDSYNHYIIDYITNENGRYNHIDEIFKNSDLYGLGTPEEVYFVLKDLSYLLATVPFFKNMFMMKYTLKENNT